ncbi:hypothetical protein N7478_006864 [Penicillium angulare]|uniref:uncharacterized protein n=1 Tax=Penicillium angulare TaxID=116970 RepID=UPI0025418592|nr:uncharacterized protein N7478_006864 [Penicillium angulare]KAJ5281492.1 hypothetical protein N7478_006864 [Penicillium angulare]
MCHSIVWYYVFCQHLDEFQSSMIQCEHATVTGYECLPYYQLILLLPLSGSCHTCLDEQQQSEDESIDVDIGIEVLFDIDEELNKESSLSEENSVLCALKSPMPVPGYHTHLYSPMSSNFEKDIRWDMKEEVDISGYDDYDDDLFPSPCFSTGGSSIYSKLDSDQSWSSQECGFPDSPTLNCDISLYDVSTQWGIASNPYEEKTWQSRIPVFVPKMETKAQTEAERVWDVDGLELFKQLTF